MRISGYHNRYLVSSNSIQLNLCFLYRECSCNEALFCSESGHLLKLSNKFSILNDDEKSSTQQNDQRLHIFGELLHFSTQFSHYFSIVGEMSIFYAKNVFFRRTDLDTLVDFPNIDDDERKTIKIHSN